MFQSEKKPDNNSVNKNQKNAKAKTGSPDYYTIMQEQHKAFNSINGLVQLKEEEEIEPLQAKTAPIQRIVKEEEEKPAQMMAREEEEKTQKKQGGKKVIQDWTAHLFFQK